MSGNRTGSWWPAYKAVQRAHLWLAALASLPLVILSITGALLVFGHEIQAALWPAEWQVDGSLEPLPFEELVARFDRQLPGIPIAAIAMEQPKGHAWTFWLGNGQGVANVDPATGTVLKHYQQNDTLYGFVRALHRWLLVPGDARSWARHLVSVAALILIIQIIVGTWMWALPPKRMKRLTIPRRGSTHLIVQRAHSVTALVTGAILALIAFTGISFNWHDTAEAVVSMVTFGPVRKPGDISTQAIAGQRDIDRAVAAARDAVPGAKLKSVNVPKLNTQPVNIRVGTSDALNVTLVRVHPVSGDVLDIHHAAHHNTATAFMQMAYKLHVGDFWGLPVRILWLLLALAPAAYVISGFWLFANRTGLRRRRQPRKP